MRYPSPLESHSRTTPLPGVTAMTAYPAELPAAVLSLRTMIPVFAQELASSNWSTVTVAVVPLLNALLW